MKKSKIDYFKKMNWQEIHELFLTLENIFCYVQREFPNNTMRTTQFFKNPDEWIVYLEKAQAKYKEDFFDSGKTILALNKYGFFDKNAVEKCKSLNVDAIKELYSIICNMYEGDYMPEDDIIPCDTYDTFDEYKNVISQYFKENTLEWSDYINGARNGFQELFEFELKDAEILLKYHFFE